MSHLPRMRKRLCSAMSLALVMHAVAYASVPRPHDMTYETSVLPLFKARCIGCHGGPPPHAGLVLRARGDLLEGGGSGPAIVPGAPERSLLVKMLASGRMPPGGPKLSDRHVQTVRRWIADGAIGQDGGGH